MVVNLFKNQASTLKFKNFNTLYTFEYARQYRKVSLLVTRLKGERG